MKNSVRFLVTLSVLVAVTVSGCTGGGQSVKTTNSPPPPPTPKPAEFSVSAMIVSPPVVLLQKETKITAEVKNTGEASGSYTADLKINGVSAQTSSVTIAGGASQPVSFTYKGANPGTLEVTIGEAKGTLTVLESASYTSPTHTFSFLYPSQWVADTRALPGISYDLADKASVGVIVLPIVPAADAQAALDNSAMPMWTAFSTQVIPGYKETSKTKTTFKNLPAYKMEFTSLFDEAKPLSASKGSAIVTVHGGMTLVLLGIVTDAEYANYWPVVDTCLNSFLPPGNPLVYHTDADGYSLVYPTTWELERDADGTFVIWAPGNVANVFVGIDHLTSPMTIEDYNAAIIESFANSSAHYTVVKSTRVTLGGAIPVFIVEYTGTSSSGTKMVLKSLTAVSGLKGFTVGSVTLEGNRPGIEPSIDTIMNTFRFLEP